MAETNLGLLGEIRRIRARIQQRHQLVDMVEQLAPRSDGLQGGILRWSCWDAEALLLEVDRLMQSVACGPCQGVRSAGGEACDEHLYETWQMRKAQEWNAKP